MAGAGFQCLEAKGLFVFLAAFLTLILSLCSAANSQPVTIGVSGNNLDVLVSRFVAEATALSPGLQIRVSPTPRPAASVLNDLHAGALGLAIVPLTALRIPSGDALTQPWLYPDAQAVSQTLRSEAAALMSTDIERTGIYAVAYWHTAFSRFARVSPAPSLDSIRGSRVVVGPPGSQAAKVVTELGGNPVIFPSGEVATALLTGAIDSAVVPVDSQFEASRYVDVLRGFVAQPYQPVVTVVLVNKAVWNQLSFEAQLALSDAAKATASVATDMVVAQEGRFRPTVEGSGGMVAVLSSEELNAAQLASTRAWEQENRGGAGFQDQLATALVAARAPAPVAAAGNLPQVEHTVFFVTSRVLENRQDPRLAFSSKGELNRLSFGSAKVTLKSGRRHDSDLDKFSTVDSITHYSGVQEFAAALDAPREDLTLFIHGYYNLFTQAISRGAAIKQDMGVPGPVLVFSWPSEAGLLAYGADEAAIDIARENVRTFIETLDRTISLSRVSVVAHSLGARLLATYVDWADGRVELLQRPKFKHIVLPAADITTDSFRLVHGKLGRAAQKITIYTSENDNALNLSKKIHSKVPVGRPDKADELLILPGMESIDASDVDKSVSFVPFDLKSRHSYVFDKTGGMKDLSQLLAGHAPAARAGLTQQRRNADVYWKLSP
jgi:esterase/lipase superfamily enzyme/TRAP-type C4-dicarboxylate transport system substrate-binding protein